jgi:hypothetical protein
MSDKQKKSKPPYEGLKNVSESFTMTLLEGTEATFAIFDGSQSVALITVVDKSRKYKITMMEIE